MNGTTPPSMKRRRLIVGNGKKNEEGVVEENPTKDTFFPSLPVEVVPTLLAVHVSKFLNRPTWNNLSMACCELFQATSSCRSTILPPWPYQTRHDCDHEVHSIVFASGDDDDDEEGGAVDDKLFVGLGNRTIQFLNRRMGWHRLQKTGHLDDITCLAYSPKDRLLASSSEDGIIQLWNTTSKSCSSSSSKRGCPTSTTSTNSSNDRNGGGVSASDGESGSSRDCYLTCIREWSGDFRRLYTLAFSPDGKYLASGGRGSTIQLWNVHDGSHRETLRGHEGCITTLSFSPDGQTLASGSHDMRVRLWHLSNDQHDRYDIQQERDGSIPSSSSGSTSTTTSTSTVLCKQEQWVISVSFSPDGEHIACGHSDCSIKLWDARTLSCKRIFCGHTGVVSSITFSLDGNKMISSSYDRTIKIWHVSSGILERTLEGHTNQIRTVALSRDGRTLASGGWDHSVRLWRI